MEYLYYFIWALWGLTLMGSLIPFLREQTWWLRSWTYARLQLLCIAVLLIGVHAALYGFKGQTPDSIFLIGMLAVIGLCLWDILPFTRLFPVQSRTLQDGEKHNPLSLIVGNVLMDNTSTEGLLSSIKTHEPDIIFLVETNEAWRERLSMLESVYPYTYLLPKAEYNGMLLYSRFPIDHVEERYLIQDHIPSITVSLDVEGKTVRFYGVHPRPPRPEDDTADLDKELAFIAHEAGHYDGPVIVTGDLNDVGWSTTTKKFLRTSGLQDPRRGRGLFNSYNAKNPIVRWPLDHIFHSRDFSLIEMERLPKFGSDHFPIYIKLALHRP